MKMDFIVHSEHTTVYGDPACSGLLTAQQILLFMACHSALTETQSYSMTNKILFIQQKVNYITTECYRNSGVLQQAETCLSLALSSASGGFTKLTYILKAQ